MREIFRPETLWREVIPIGIFALVVFIIFLLAFFNTEDLAGAQGALIWTMNAVGALLAVLATFGLFWRALHGDPLDLQFGFVLALLAGLLLVNVHWSLAIALGIIGVSLIVREIWFGRSGSRYSPPSDRPLS
jgi:membrane protease YdiL (CAAX protease family)